eukprot:3228160-Rhodomonas_salina.2
MDVGLQCGVWLSRHVKEGISPQADQHVQKEEDIHGVFVVDDVRIIDRPAGDSKDGLLPGTAQVDGVISLHSYPLNPSRWRSCAVSNASRKGTIRKAPTTMHSIQISQTLRTNSTSNTAYKKTKSDRNHQEQDRLTAF